MLLNWKIYLDIMPVQMSLPRPISVIMPIFKPGNLKT